MKTPIDQDVEIDPAIEEGREKDMRKENDRLDEDGAGNEIIVIGETIPMMTEHVDDVRGVLTRGPVTEATKIATKDPAEKGAQNPLRYFTPPIIIYLSLANNF